MLTFIREEITIWEYLKTADKPIVIYGTGDGADKVLARLAENEITVSGIFVSDEFMRGQQFYGFTVHKYSELLEMTEPVIVLIVFASEVPEVLNCFYELEKIHETYAPHVPIFSGDEVVTPEWIKKYGAELQTVYDRLADDASREVFAAVLNYKISGKISYLKSCTTARAEDLRTIFSFGKEETFADLGAYNGDTIQEFLQLTRQHYHKIFAVEPDPKNFKKLTDYVWKNNLENIKCLQAGIWKDCGMLEFRGTGGRQSAFEKAGQTLMGKNPAEVPLGSGRSASALPKRVSRRKQVKTQWVDVMTVDAILGEQRADYLKFDVEGLEREALEGAVKHLTPNRDGNLPKLLIAAYHHDEDIFTLPLLLWKLQPQYRLYLRKHLYVPAWEINIFAK